MTATISSIVYAPKTADHPPVADGYDRVPLQTAVLAAGHGIVGDRKGGRPHRQLNLMSSETLDRLAREGFKTAPGQLGEQIIIAGLDIDALKAGDRLQMGDAAVIEIVKPRTGCGKFAAIQGLAASRAANRLGMLARVIEGGQIAVGSAVRLVAEESV